MIFTCASCGLTKDENPSVYTLYANASDFDAAMQGGDPVVPPVTAQICLLCSTSESLMQAYRDSVFPP